MKIRPGKFLMVHVVTSLRFNGKGVVFKTGFSFMIGLLFCNKGLTQNPDTTIFSERVFIEQLKKYHPVAKQAAIQVEKAKADVLAARGAFDPVLNLDASNKIFNGKEYYSYVNPELQVPLPIGNITSGVENNRGDFINPQLTKGQSSYLGIDLPLARGLLTDKRRSVLLQAKIFRNQTEQERRLQLNNLVADACTAYWNWAGAYQLKNIYANFSLIANDRLRLVKILHNSGDRPAMDTVEAFVQLQYYQLRQNEALLNWTNAALELSKYLWLENDSSYDLPFNAVPELLTTNAELAGSNADQFIATSNNENPALKIYAFKLGILETERKLKRQNILPYIGVKANILNRDYYPLKGLSSTSIENNYRLGINFRLPLSLREARGEYAKARLKVLETELEFAYKKQETEVKIRSYYNEVNTIVQQLKTADVMTASYRQLLRNEELKFSQGESSLFFVNTRELKLMENIEKQIELRLKYQKAKYSLLAGSGMLF